jgi:hypothetical protein
MKTFIKPIFLIAISFSLVFFNSCETDDDEQVKSDLIGTWTIDDSDVEIKVGGVDLVDYLIEMFDIPQEQAQDIADLLSGDYGDVEASTITFNEDNTYQVNFGDGVENGTWSVSSDGKTLTITEVNDDGEDYVDNLTITSLTSSMLVLTLPTETEEIDLDEDGINETTMEISVVITLTK